MMRHAVAVRCAASSRPLTPLTQSKRTASSTTSYASQDRGGDTQYRLYRESMDAIAVDKVASASSFFGPARGDAIVDVGVASGTSTALLARLFPEQQIIGVEINPAMVDAARAAYPTRHYPNLSFRLDDGETLTTFSPPTSTSMLSPAPRLHGFFNCSCLHHVTSFNGYDFNRAIRALHRQAALLAPHGVIVVRDFPRMSHELVQLELRAEATPAQHARGQPSDADLLVRFSHEARNLAPESERGFPLEELSNDGDASDSSAEPLLGWRRFRLLFSDAAEFIRRKDYWSDWAVELHEEYGYLTPRQFERVFRDAGMRVVLSSPLYNEWILRHRYRDQFRLRRPTRAGEWEDMGLPPTNFLIAAEKIGTRSGTQLHLLRHLPSPLSQSPPTASPSPSSSTCATSYLQYEEYVHTPTGRVFETVSRPHPVVDILPCFLRRQCGVTTTTCVDGDNSAEESREAGEAVLYVLAKHSYPRPLLTLFRDATASANTEGEGVPSLDGKISSGYVTECMAVAGGPLTALVPAQPLDAPAPPSGSPSERAELLRKTAAETLQTRCAVPAEHCGEAFVLHPVYFPSAGGISECVSSIAVELNELDASAGTSDASGFTLPRPMPSGFSGFAEGGTLRAFKAEQLLLTAQTGALVEARLEVSVYRLLNARRHPLPPWLGEVFTPPVLAAGPPANVCSVEAMLNGPPAAHFERCVRDKNTTTTTPSTEKTPHRVHSFLRPQRAMFAELGVVGSIATIDYVTPRTLSCHTVTTLPLHTTTRGEHYVGLELRELPVPQLYRRASGCADCQLWCLPARRLPRTVSSLHTLEQFLRDPAQHCLDGSRTVAALQPLGPKYCPSLGVTPEQVYPYIVALSPDADDDAHRQVDHGCSSAPPLRLRAPRLHWVRADDLWARMDRLEDGHLVLSLSRLQHMLATHRPR